MIRLHALLAKHKLAIIGTRAEEEKERSMRHLESVGFNGGEGASAKALKRRASHLHKVLHGNATHNARMVEGFEIE